MKLIFTSLCTLLITCTAFSQLNMSLLGRYQYDFGTNEVWGYMAPSGDEYALVGTRRGLSIVDINKDTLKEVAFLEGSNSTWRDIKTWGDFAYVSTEAADGLLVVDLRNLPDSTTSYFWQPEWEDQGTLFTIHNLFIDEFGTLFIIGSNLNGGGNILVDVASEPGVPKLIDFAPNIYSHDAYARDSILYASEIYAGRLAIYDFHKGKNFELLGSTETPNKFTHNAWLSDDSKTIFTTDERAGAFVAAYDISDFGNIAEVDRYRPAATIDEARTPHNVHVWNDWLVISYYEDGGLIVDASRPDNLIEVGNFDTFFPETDPGFGVWGAYPFLPSGKILLTDNGNGLFVLEPNYVHGAFLEGTVKGRTVDSNGVETIIALISSEIKIISDEAVTPVTTKAEGIFKTGKAISGKYLVEISAENYDTWIDSVTFENGIVTELNVILNGEGSTVGIKENLLPSNAFSIFPNPASDFINIKVDVQQLTTGQVEIQDQLGRTVFSNSFTNSQMQPISLSTYATGVYFAKVTSPEGKFAVHKFLIQ